MDEGIWQRWVWAQGASRRPRRKPVVTVWEVAGVTEADVKKIVPVPNRDEYTIHLWNWRKIRVNGLQVVRGYL